MATLSLGQIDLVSARDLASFQTYGNFNIARLLEFSFLRLDRQLLESHMCEGSQDSTVSQDTRKIASQLCALFLLVSRVSEIWNCEKRSV